MIQSQNWPEPKVDYEVDDKTGKFEVSYQVYYDESERPWDVYLTKVDLKNGIYGDYVFYKM